MKIMIDTDKIKKALKRKERYLHQAEKDNYPDTVKARRQELDGMLWLLHEQGYYFHRDKKTGDWLFEDHRIFTDEEVDAMEKQVEEKAREILGLSHMRGAVFYVQLTCDGNIKIADQPFEEGICFQVDNGVVRQWR